MGPFSGKVSARVISTQLKHLLAGGHASGFCFSTDCSAGRYPAGGRAWAGQHFTKKLTPATAHGFGFSTAMQMVGTQPEGEHLHWLGGYIEATKDIKQVK